MNCLLNKIGVLACVIALFGIQAIAQAEVNFTGNVDNDFPAGNCQDDPGGKEVGIPATYPIAVSGFDIAKLCLQYDPDTDILYAGIGTWPNPGTGSPAIFGDADGNGDASSVDPAISAVIPAFFDFADLGTAEFFALIIDFDNDLASPPEFIAGVSLADDVSEYKVAELADPPQPLSVSFFAGAYGSAIATSSDSEIAFSPDGTHPSLEFTVTNFSKIDGFEFLDFSNTSYDIGVFFSTGSFGDGGIGEDSFGNANGLNNIDLSKLLEPVEENEEGNNDNIDQDDNSDDTVQNDGTDGNDATDQDNETDGDDTKDVDLATSSGSACQNTTDPDLCNYSDAFIQGGSFGCSLSNTDTKVNKPTIYIITILFLAVCFCLVPLRRRI